MSRRTDSYVSVPKRPAQAMTPVGHALWLESQEFERDAARLFAGADGDFRVGCYPAAQLTDTAAERLAEIEQLMHMPVFDEHGFVLGYQSLITPEEARRLMDLPEDGA